VLYLNYNGTGAPPADMEVVVPQKQVLLNASGTQWDPVTNVQFKGITYTGSSYTCVHCDVRLDSPTPLTISGASF
jgi:hypothetical protein